MVLKIENDYRNSLEDFHTARRRAAIDDILARLTGKSSRMLRYDEVRTQLQGLESANKKLKEIPLDSIVGTVSRYHDFNRKLLPLNKNDGDRWARVKRAVETPLGLPPIEVYQIGDAYFILDGHHRASIARDLGAKHIQAYVREVFTRVPLSPTDQPDDLILKSEYTEFLKQTHIDETIPLANLEVSAPGSYEKLLEHISVHRYFMGIDQKRAIPYEEAILHWYEQVYKPVVSVIRQRNLLQDFPGRTEADLYLWIMNYRSELEKEVGWKISTSKAANDLITRFSPTFYNFFRRIASRLFDFLTPDQFELQPPPGSWRQQKEKANNAVDGLFENIVVAVTGNEAGWPAVEFAAQIAKNENAALVGLHLINSKIAGPMNQILPIQERFNQISADAGIESTMIVDRGNITRALYRRSFWCDLLVLRLSYPPPLSFLRRVGSGLRTLIRLSEVPILVVPPSARLCYQRVILAYGGGHKADEALFMAAYLAKRWNTELLVVTVRRNGADEHALAQRAREYLASRNILNASYIEVSDLPPAEAILKVSNGESCDLILTGGYEGGYFRELMFGSTVDRILQKARGAVMICH